MIERWGMALALSPHLFFMRSTQFRLLLLAAACMTFYAVALTLAPAARAHSWQVDYRWDHWIGWLVWGGSYALIHWQSQRYLKGHDPYLIPILALLSGWGVLAIWRLYPSLGLRQSIWMLLCGGIFGAGLRLAPQLDFLRRYKYVWFTAGLC